MLFKGENSSIYASEHPIIECVKLFLGRGLDFEAVASHGTDYASGGWRGIGRMEYPFPCGGIRR